MAAPLVMGRGLEDLPVAVALVDEAGVIRAVNPAAVRRYGWRNDAQAIGLSAAVLGPGLPERLASAPWRGELPATGGGAGTFLASFDVARHGDGYLVVCGDASPRAAVERTAERLARLQVVTARLGEARDVEAVASVVCDHAAAGIGAERVAFVRIVDDAERVEVVRQLGFGDAPPAVEEALRTGELVTAGDAAAVPMTYAGRVLGAVAFGFRRPRAFDDDDRRFLLAVAAQAAQALDRARADDAERQIRRRQELLARATGLLAGSLDHEASVDAIARLTVQHLADSCAVHLREGDQLGTVTVAHADPDVEAAMRAMVATPAGAAAVRYLEGIVASGRSLLTPEIAPDAWVRVLGDEAGAAMASLDLASAIVVPLRSRGRQLGVVVLTRSARREPFDHDAFVLVTELASRLASTIEAALAHRAHAEVARTLQASLLPPHLPEIDGIRIATRYDPIGDGSLVGGDFYDVFRAGDRWVVVLGDVCGQGVPAAAFTAQVRYTIRAAARMWAAPSEILRFTNDAIVGDELGDRFCTILLATLEPHGGGVDVTLASAGHHLPLYVPPGGEARAVGATGTALGLVPAPELRDARVRLDVGDMLVLTTDGVTEARQEDGSFVGDRFLEDLVTANAGGGAESVAGVIERAVLAVGGGRAHDDVAVLVVEAVGTSGLPPADRSGGTVFDRRYPAESPSVSEARRDVQQWLSGRDTPGERVPDLLLALTELATNAVRAARTAVEVRCWLTTDAVMLEVTDDGAGFDAGIPRSRRELDPLAERGRGLFLVAALVDECTIESGPNGTIVRCYVSR